jgi:1-deoxy-D-xylulose-5-phosphate reductoisomerase
VRRRVSLLGSTGSIGESTLHVIRHHSDRLKVEALAALGSKLDRLEQQVREFRPSLVAVGDPLKASELEGRVGDMTRVVSGDSGLLDAARLEGVDLVVAAVVGAAGLPATHAALEAGKDVALANKESLVVAGRLLTELAEASGASLLPIDSEHVALHQSLRSGHPSEVFRLMLTASGGPFRTREISSWGEIGPEEALRHPTWRMGAKISIDSATLMNKGLELIEAHHLFDVPPDRIEVVVHPQSIVHSLVEYRDGSWLAQMSVNDMIFPIQYALSYPDRWENEFDRLEPHELGRLDFEPVDSSRFPSVRLARSTLSMGDSAPAVLNAANEVAVHAFLEGKIPFPAIVSSTEKVLESHDPGPIASLEDALQYDAWGRRRARELLRV